MAHIYSATSQVQSLLGSLTLGQLDALARTNPQAALSLIDSFNRTAGSPLSQFLAGGIPPAGYMPSPHMALPINAPICGCGYGGRETVDLARGVPNTWFQRVFGGRREAANFERYLRNNPSARHSFESAVGGRIVSFGSQNDGRFTIERFPRGYAPIPGQAFNPMANTALGIFGQMDAAVLGQAGGLGLGGGGLGIGTLLAGGALAGAASGLLPGLMMGNPFLGLVTGGLSGVMMGLGGMGTGLNMGMAGLGGIGMGIGQFGMGGFPFGMGGLGAGSWNPLAMPGNINNTNPLYERAHQMQVASVLYDPSLTVEDKVTLLIMLIMKKMDKDIERQAQYINSIQQQQSNRNQMGGMMGSLGGIAGTIFGGPVGGMLGGTLGGMLGGAGQSSPSIDVETMKLKRMIDKRSQMFDMLRQIIDKYNETAKNIIQSIGR